jgi:riboflavin synthase
MFTGIITDLGRVLATEKAASGDRRVAISCGFDLARVPLGASIACSGVCLTVVEKELGDGKKQGWFAVEASAETLAKTTLGTWRPGSAVNLETALRMGDELGGHFVSGHVDGVGRVATAVPEGGSVRVTVAAPAPLMRLIAAKGSVALDGVSLTVNEVDGTSFGVNIIDHTRRATTLSALEAGVEVNLEIDLLARYVARLLDRS